ncbi:MAG: hypothetical protein V2B18_23325, partial [Pseudomonadota bacterium]
VSSIKDDLWLYHFAVTLSRFAAGIASKHYHVRSQRFASRSKRVTGFFLNGANWKNCSSKYAILMARKIRERSS